MQGRWIIHAISCHKLSPIEGKFFPEIYLEGGLCLELFYEVFETFDRNGGMDSTNRITEYRYMSASHDFITAAAYLSLPRF